MRTWPILLQRRYQTVGKHIVSRGSIVSSVDGRLADVDERGTYGNQEEYTSGHRSEGSTVEHTRIHVSKQSDDRRSNEGNDVGAVEDLCVDGIISGRSKLNERERGRT